MRFLTDFAPLNLGLDTSCILRYLLDEGYSVVCFLADVGEALQQRFQHVMGPYIDLLLVGQEEDWDIVREKARKIGAEKMVIEDLQKEFVEELCFRAVQCNAQVRPDSYFGYRH